MTSELRFAGPIGAFLNGAAALRDLTLASSVGMVIIIMAVTDTEHPPAAGTVLGMSIRAWDPLTTLTIVGAVLLLACIKHLLQRYFRDLI